MDALAPLRALIEGQRRRLGLSREELASRITESGLELDAETIRHYETRCRRPPDPEKLRAVAIALGLTYEAVTGAVTLGMERW